MSELRLRVKPKPGDREPTPADYESIEEDDDEENVIETEGKCLVLFDFFCVLVRVYSWKIHETWFLIV